MRLLGVGCIVWYLFPRPLGDLSLTKTQSPYSCLDDVELAYLGVSWSDYARIADENGIDVLRSDLLLLRPITPPDGYMTGYHYQRGWLH